MKNALRLLALTALAAVFALPAYAQDTAATPAATPAGPCAEAEAKAALYGKFRENFNKGAEQQKVAYEAGKDYISKYESCTKESDRNVIGYVGKWVAKYEAALREWQRAHGRQP